MQKFSRSLIAIGALAGLAACGDDVSITQPVPPAPAVTGLTVTPAVVTLSVGQTAQLAATVTANDASVARTVNWTTSAAAVATVSATGLVTAVGSGVTTITATATADANFRAATQVTVGGRGIQSVEVQPASASIAPGDNLQAVANVTADPGVARTVTWTSSAPTVATVTSAGVITGVAAGTASIIARSTVDTSIFGAMALTVRQAAPATVSIKTITRNFGGLQAPVDIANVFGQIDVTLNVDPGDRILCKVSVQIDGTEVASQTFGSANIQISDSALMAVVPVDVTLSVNTRAYDATTGVATFKNGPRSLSAQLFVRSGAGGACSSTAPAATVTQTLTFRNVSGFIGTLTTSGGASANDVPGLTWKSGALTVSALPVLFGDVNAPFTVPTIASAQINMGTGGCVNGITRGQPAALSGTSWAASFNNTDAAAAATNVVGYELNGVLLGCTPILAVGEVPTISAVGSDGNAVVMIAGGFLNSPNLIGNQFAEPNANFAIRLDNQAPTRPAIDPLCILCVGGFLYTNTTDTLRTGNWLNTALVLNEAFTVVPNPPGGVPTATQNMDGTIPVPPGTLVRNSSLSKAVDNGVGRIVNGIDPLNYQTRVGDTSLGTTAIDATATVTTATGLAESSSNATYTIRARVADQLANRSGASTQAFGVDNTAPRLGVDTATTTAAVVSASKSINILTGVLLTGVNIAFVAQDTASGGATPSGFFNLAGNPLVTSVRRITWTGTATQTRWLCPAAGFQATIAGGGAVCPEWFNAANQDFRGALTQTFLTAGTTQGYFLTTSVVLDQAGNISGTQTVEFLYDITAPAVGGISSPAFLTGGTTATFSTSAQDNLDLGSGVFTLAYLGTADPFRYPPIAMGTFGSDVFTVTASLALQYSFIRNMQLAPGGTPNGAVGNIPNTVTATASDVAGNPSTVSTLTIPAGSIQGTPVAFPALPAVQGFSWNITAPAAAITVGRDDPAATNVSVVITAQAVGHGSGVVLPLTPLQNPFTARVEFWAQSAVGQQWRQIGISTSPSVLDTGPTRTWSFSITWNPSSTDAPVAAAGYRIIAVGVSAAGDALQATANTNVTITVP